MKAVIQKLERICTILMSAKIQDASKTNVPFGCVQCNPELRYLHGDGPICMRRANSHGYCGGIDAIIETDPIAVLGHLLRQTKVQQPASGLHATRANTGLLGADLGNEKIKLSPKNLT